MNKKLIKIENVEKVLKEIFNEWEIDDEIQEWVFKEIKKEVEK